MIHGLITLPEKTAKLNFVFTIFQIDPKFSVSVKKLSFENQLKFTQKQLFKHRQKFKKIMENKTLSDFPDNTEHNLKIDDSKNPDPELEDSQPKHTFEVSIVVGTSVEAFDSAKEYSPNTLEAAQTLYSLSAEASNKPLDLSNTSATVVKVEIPM